MQEWLLVKNLKLWRKTLYFLFLDIDKIDDPVKRNAAISFINNFGQMPKQVNTREHVFLCVCICMWDGGSLVPRSSLAFRRLQYEKVGRVGIFYHVYKHDVIGN